MRRRSALDSFGLGGRDRDPGPAPTVESYAGYHVGQVVSVHSRPDTVARGERPSRHPVSFTGVIRKLVIAPFWKFALVEDGLCRHHACDLTELV